jgi:hypothetical protein
MEPWSLGALEPWSLGALEPWSLGALENSFGEHKMAEVKVYADRVF